MLLNRVIVKEQSKREQTHPDTHTRSGKVRKAGKH